MLRIWQEKISHETKISHEKIDQKRRPTPDLARQIVISLHFPACKRDSVGKVQFPPIKPKRGSVGKVQFPPIKPKRDSVGKVVQFPPITTRN
jgi:hypothetical protein